MAQPERKSLSLALDPEQEGVFRARIATFNVVDKDDEVTLPGAFPIGKRVLISAYSHGSWDSGLSAVPIGDGTTSSDMTGAYVEGKFWLDTFAGRETYKAVKNAADLQEWSYGFKTTASSVDSTDLAAYPGARRILKTVDIFEISPVLVGAGVDTATMSIKSARGMFMGSMPQKVSEAIASLKAGTLDSSAIAAIAQVDAMMDELDDAVDALMAQFGIPDPDATDDAAENEAPSDPVASDDPMTNPDAEFGKGLSFANHSEHALAGVKAFISRAKSLADLRAKKQRKDGRVLSATNRVRLNALHDGLAAHVAELRDLLDSTSPSTDTGDALDTGDDGDKAATQEVLATVWLDMQRRQAALIRA
jgi:phage head maturation protease